MKKLFFTFFLFAIQLSVKAQVSLPYLFSDHMVLQRGKPIPVWGWAEKGSQVRVELNGNSCKSEVNDQGEWKVLLPPMKAGGPYQLQVFLDAEEPAIKVFEDVLIGDVWLASGQSNMEWQVQQSDDAEMEITNAFNSNIRLFNVPHFISLEPLSNTIATSWKVCDSTSVKDFSAVAYYFAKAIQPEAGVPMGIIQSTWGGTPVEAWTSREMLQSNPEGRKSLQQNDTIEYTHLVKDSADINRFWDIVYQPKNGMDTIIPALDFDDSNWLDVKVPGVIAEWEPDFYEGMVWLRKTIELGNNWTKQDLQLHLGHPEMNYSLYFNDQEISKTVWNAELNHDYRIPSELLKTGKNTITIRMAALWGGGGLKGPAEDIFMSNGKKQISLAGQWKYKKDLEPEIPKVHYYHQYPNYIYNAMVNPLIPYALKGFLWYQGEHNEGQAYEYRQLLPLMINDWRIRWQSGNLPFLLVQLPNYKSIEEEPSDGNWAVMRESQAEALWLPNTYMTCLIDCGEAENIHPTNKTVVGQRLANVAAKNCYGKDVVASGPVFKGFSVKGNEIVIQFGETGNGLAVKNCEVLKGFAVAGEDQVFYWAEARIESDQVIVKSDKVAHPVAVRYAWANNPVCNLINKEGLPAVPFRTDSWKVITQP